MKSSTLGALAIAFVGLASAQKPSPTQPGIIASCTEYYLVKQGDFCAKIVADFKNRFTLADFLKWNPDARSDCTNLLAGYYACVAVPTSTTLTTSTTTSTTSTTSTSTGIATPTPTQPGMVKNCDRFYYVKSGDNCYKIAPLYNVGVEDLKKWNPAVGSECSTMLPDTYLCVHVAEPRITCNTDTTFKTWGDNQPYAIEAINTFCNDSTAAEGAVYEIAEKRAGCINARLGQNKFTFTMDNNAGVRAGLSLPKCKTLLASPVQDCARGGVGVQDGWKFTGSVTAGQC
jgi:LysM repeat protein